MVNGYYDNWDKNAPVMVVYIFSQSQSSCVVPQKTNDQICQKNYGLNSNWDGTKTNDGRLQCSCQSGYQWNQGQSSCVVMPKPKITPESSVMKKDSKSSERTNQQSSLNSSISNNDKSGNSSSIFSDEADSIYKDRHYHNWRKIRT